MSPSPRLFDAHGKFLPLSAELEKSLKDFDADRHARYIALRYAAVASEAAEIVLKETETKVADARQRYVNTIKSRDRQFPRMTQTQLAKQFARTEHIKRAVAHGVLPAAALVPSRPAASRGGEPPDTPSLLSDFNKAIHEADLHVTAMLHELADARVAVKAARATLADAWKAHVAHWAPLTAEQNVRARIKSEQDRRRREHGGRNAMGDTIETIQFVAKQMRTGNHRGASSKLDLMRRRAELKRKQNEASHGG